MSCCFLVSCMYEATCLCNSGTSTCLHLSWDEECCVECSWEYERSPSAVSSSSHVVVACLCCTWNLEDGGLVVDCRCKNRSYDRWFRKLAIGFESLSNCIKLRYRLCTEETTIMLCYYVLSRHIPHFHGDFVLLQIGSWNASSE